MRSDLAAAALFLAALAPLRAAGAVQPVGSHSTLGSGSTMGSRRLPATGAAVGSRPTLEEALEMAFPKAVIERGTWVLTAAERERVVRLCGEAAPPTIVHPYVARSGETVLGTAWVDVHRVRTLEQTLLVVVDPEHRVRRVEILAFAEPEEYVPRGRWYGQFQGRALDEELRLDRGIRGVTGATLTARATTSAVRRVLALDAVAAERAAGESGDRSTAGVRATGGAR